jgi:hypothetical protein
MRKTGLEVSRFLIVLCYPFWAVFEPCQKIEERLEGIAASSQKSIRLKALRYGIALLESEIQWLTNEIGRMQ